MYTEWSGPLLKKSVLLRNVFVILELERTCFSNRMLMEHSSKNWMMGVTCNDSLDQSVNSNKSLFERTMFSNASLVWNPSEGKYFRWAEHVNPSVVNLRESSSEEDWHKSGNFEMIPIKSNTGIISEL
jgi:hypothetical protein